MDKINPLLLITDSDPIPEAVMDVSGWFLTETMAIASDSEDAQYMGWYLAQGWQKQADTTETTTTGQYWQWLDGSAPVDFNTHPSFATLGYDLYTTTRYFISGMVTFRGRYFDITHTDKIHHLVRRRLQSEKVMQSLVTDFTKAYNEGREINDQRYDELVVLYDTMVDKTEDEINGLVETDDYYTGLMDTIAGLLPTDFAAYEDDVDGLLDDWGDAAKARVNTQFDNQSSKVAQGLVDRGMYNSTVWTSTSTGVEDTRAQALLEIDEKIIELQLKLKDRIEELRVRMRLGVLDAYARLMDIKQKNALRPLEFRNQMLTLMLTFMERRTDDYPGLDGIANIAAQLGYADTPSTVATTA